MVGFHCRSCRLIYPVKGRIPILLPKYARRYDLEHSLINKIPRDAPGMKRSVANTLRILDRNKKKGIWEWEDEQFWSQEYRKILKNAKKRKSTEIEMQRGKIQRIWQREHLLKSIVSSKNLEGKTIIDVGGGDGYTFRSYMAPSCGKDTLYVATDISFEALRLNRFRNPHKNSLYILCSADKLPFRKESVDILCYFGILHHTARKERNLTADVAFLKKGGFLFLHEALDHFFSVSTLLPQRFRPKNDDSVHEERINKTRLLREIGKNKDMAIVGMAEFGTFFLSFVGFLLNTAHLSFMNNRTFFNVMFAADRAFHKLFHRILPLGRGAEIIILLRKAP